MLISIATAAETQTEAQTLRLGYVNFPPFTHSDEHGQAQGIFIDQVKQHFKTLNLRMSTVELPAKRLYNYLAEGKIDLFIGIKTAQEIKGKVYTSSLPIGHINMNLYYLNNEQKSYENIAAVSGLRIGAIRGYSYGSILDTFEQEDKQNSIHRVTDRQSGYAMFKLGRIDAFLDYKGPSDPFLKQFDQEKISALPVMDLSCYYVLNKQTAQAQQIIKQLNKLLEQKTP